MISACAVVGVRIEETLNDTDEVSGVSVTADVVMSGVGEYWKCDIVFWSMMLSLISWSNIDVSSC